MIAMLSQQLFSVYGGGGGGRLTLEHPDIDEHCGVMFNVEAQLIQRRHVHQTLSELLVKFMPIGVDV